MSNRDVILIYSIQNGEPLFYNVEQNGRPVVLVIIPVNLEEWIADQVDEVLGGLD